ncbi:flagellin [Halosolutus amylolyticus]|uniref:Flagellin n=1 Tax=Halosolutus amylolyticus TaxID=2932267 RepID=A0ABD5PQD1_9EURY|nr:flagellin [Halosolutus amylolyticus]
MGFSTSGAVAIVFVGMLVAVGIAYPAVQTAHEERSASIDDRDDRALEIRNTAIDAGNVTYDGTADELTVNVTNTGSTTLSVSETDLLIDGVYRSTDDWTATIDGTADRDLWQPGERLTIEVESVADEPARVKLVTEHGIAATVTEIEEV